MRTGVREAASSPTVISRPFGQAPATVAGPIAEAPIVGRDSTLGILTDVIREVRESHANVCVISGEPGVGKTTVIQDLLARAAVLGCTVLSGRAHEYDSSIAFAALKDALASLSDDPLVPAVRKEADHLLEVLDNAVDLATPDVESGSQSPYALTTRLLRTLAMAGPCIVAVDDAHLADSESLAALSLAIRHLRNERLLMVFAVRTSDWVAGTPFAATVGRLVEQGTGTTLSLPVLTESQIGELINGSLGGPPDEHLTGYVFAQCRGNPLFARETLLSLIASEEIQTDRGRYYLKGNPSGVVVSHRGALLHRIFRQDQDSRRLARVMSAFGRVHLDQVDLLAELTELEPPRLQRAFDQLCESAVLKRVGPYGFEFVHPLIAEVLYDDLGPVERRRLHASIRQSLDSNTNDRTGPLERARHAIEAASPGDQDAVAVALQAAHVTWNTAPLSAARWLERAVGLLEDDSEQAASILARQTRAYWKGSRPDLAIAAGTRAARLLPPGPARTSTAITVVNAVYAMGRLSDAIALSLSLVPEDDPPVAVLAQRSLVLGHLGRTDEAREAKGLVWQRLDNREPEEAAVAYSYLTLAENLLGGKHAWQRAQDALWALATDTDLVAAGARYSALETWAHAERLADRPSVEGREVEAAKILTESIGWRDLGGQASVTLARRQLAEGRWPEALESVHKGAIALDFAGLATNLAWLRTVEVGILINQGAVPQAQAALDSVRLPEEGAYWCAVRDILETRINDVLLENADTTKRLIKSLELGAAKGWQDIISQSIEGLIDVALDRDNLDGLRRCEAQICAVRKTPDMSDRAANASAIAVALLERNRSMLETLLAVPSAERVSLRRARLHMAAAAADIDVQHNLDAAVRIFENLGAKAWIGRARRIGKNRSVAIPTTNQAPVSVAPLRDTEMQMLRLVREGKNNREIAEIMHYSRKTVEAYLSRLYRKAGCNSRVTLIVAAEKAGWLGPEPSAS